MARQWKQEPETGAMPPYQTGWDLAQVLLLYMAAPVSKAQTAI